MTMMESLMWGIALFWLVLLWSVLLLHRYRILLRPLERTSEPGEVLSEWPPVSVLVPARNEEHRILREALGSILRQDYPDVEVLVVNDRSTDRTSEILREIAREDARVQVIEGEEPPPGWLGKPFALHQASLQARGEWLLAVDADVLLHPAALRAALQFARERELDALSLLPRFECVSFWDRVIEPQALNLLRLGMLVAAWKERTRRERPGWRARSVETRHPLALLNAYVGDRAFTIGAFTLVRREALEGIGGYAAIRGEVLDETILGMRLRQHGYRVAAVDGTLLIRTPARGTFRELWEAYSRSICAAIGGHWLRALVGGGALLLLAVSPPFVALWGAWRGAWSLAIPAAVAYGAMSLLSARLSDGDGTPRGYGLLAFLGYAVFALIALTAPWRLRFGRGVMWRGRCVCGARSKIQETFAMAEHPGDV
jgi:cellulose synthase/poly-beta-1,6-N-acetylglucosamine synthase-like glycosyltransferase